MSRKGLLMVRGFSMRNKNNASEIMLSEIQEDPPNNPQLNVLYLCFQEVLIVQ